jgi:MYXO-CTERM domain-containing protein
MMGGMTLRTFKSAGALLLAVLLAPLPGRAADTPPKILEPQDTDAVPSTFMVVVDPGTYDYCDTDGCFETIPEGVSMLVDDEYSGQGSVEDGEATVEVTLAPGMYSLVARSEPFLGPPQRSAAIMVLVETTGTDTDTDTDTDASSGTDTDAATGTDTESTGGDTATGGSSPVDEGGCACAATDGRAAPWWAVFGVGALVLRRRR